MASCSTKLLAILGIYIIAGAYFQAFAFHYSGAFVSDTLPASNTDTLRTENKASAAISQRPDRIVKRNGNVIVCHIVVQNLFEVDYTLPGSDSVIKMSTAGIREVQYGNGKKVLVDNNPEKKPKDWVTPASEKEWANIQVFYDPAAVATLVEKGPVDAFYEAKKMNTDNDVLERSTIIVLQRKAITLKGCAILITGKEFRNEYGELPAIYIKATVFAKE